MALDERFQNLERSIDLTNRRFDLLNRTVRDVTRTFGGGPGRRGIGGPQGPAGAPGGASAGGRASLAAFRSHPAVAAVGAAVRVAAPLGVAGLTNAARGGSFQAGFAAQLNQLAAESLPFGLGELTGVAPTERIRQGAAQGAQQRLGRIAEVTGAGAISDEQIRRTVQTTGFQARQQEEIRQRVQVETNRQLPQLAEGQGAIPEAIANLTGAQVLGFLLGGGPGYQLMS